MAPISTLFLNLLAIGIVAAHPGQAQAEKRAKIKARADYLASLQNSDLVHCVDQLAKRGHVERTIERRNGILKDLRKRRGLSEDGRSSERRPGQIQSKTLLIVLQLPISLSNVR